MFKILNNICFKHFYTILEVDNVSEIGLKFLQNSASPDLHNGTIKGFF